MKIKTEVRLILILFAIGLPIVTKLERDLTGVGFKWSWLEVGIVVLASVIFSLIVTRKISDKDNKIAEETSNE